MAEQQLSRSEKKALSRRRILDAAREVFFRDGFMAANLDEVAERAGVAKGTLYRYFESKADLYVAVLVHNARAFVDKVRVEARKGSTATERMLHLSDYYYRHWSTHRQYFQIFWAIDNQDVIGDLPQPALQEVMAIWEDCLEIVDEILRDGVEAGEFGACETKQIAKIIWLTATALIRAESNVTQQQLYPAAPAEIYGQAIRLIVRGLASAN